MMKKLKLTIIRSCHPERPKRVEGSLANARQTPIQARFLVSLGMTLIAFAFLILNSHFAYAQNVSYPIPALGSCANARECQLYCKIPANTPACWSYEKYVMHSDVLGETAVNITYPITELGNCNSASECFVFCNQPQNQTSCYEFAKARGLIKEKPKVPENIVELAKKELGCKSDLECMVFCQQPDNIDACRAFGQKYNLIPPPDSRQMGPPPAVMENAKSELGCDSETSCMKYCDNPQNREKCFEFAKKNNLIHEDEVKNIEKMRENKKKMLEAAKEDLGCDSIESCAKVCSEDGNREKCHTLERKFDKPHIPCTSESECRKYCESHPNECPGMSGRPNTNASDTALSKPSDQPPGQTFNPQKGDFLGPSGCKTEDECKAFCEKHPGECPGFPKKPDQTSVNPSVMPEVSENRTSRKTNEKNKPPMMKKQNTNPQDYQNEMPNNAPNIPGISQPPPNQSMNPSQENSTQYNPPSNPSEFPH